MFDTYHLFAGTGILVSVGGAYVAYLYGKDTTQFRWSEYAALLAAPTLVVFAYAYIESIRILYLYMLSSCVGFAFEYLLGLAYFKVLNRKLWVYDSHAYAVGDYTSLLTLPMWGIAGVIFWSLGKLVGL